MPNKIPGSHSHPIKHTNNDQSKSVESGRLGKQHVAQTEPNEYLDKDALSPNGPELTTRKVTQQHLDMVLSLANEKKWKALSSAIDVHGQTISSIEQIIETLQDHKVELPANLQNQICQQFGKLSAMIKAVTLKSLLPEEPQQELEALHYYLGGHQKPNGVTGTLARFAIDDFIETHNLHSADRQLAVEHMSATIYEVILLRVMALQEIVKRQSNDTQYKDWLKTSHHEMSLEYNHLQSIKLKA
ncbi:hypothetical protein [uncultured Endozoicomonas sp.]|uniref:hypothetical protein n=1 Tax=uncultured Endozoicomonas sp. TaxID=432652 RepID=UPI0026265C13|nr:hypothetical protein [uncultured Endozoicomonas sp.]